MAISNGTNGTTNGTSNGHAALNFTNFYNTIDGKNSKTATTRHQVNPSTLEPNPEVPVSTQADVDKAVEAAKAAFPAWSDLPVEERRKKIHAFADALEAHADEFAKLLVSEQGKPLAMAQFEVRGSAKNLKTQSSLSLPEEVVDENDDRIILTRYTPIGVALGIVPWNFPVTLAVGKIGPALATGNVIIIKPSPFTPYCGLKLAELGQQFFPPGVFQALSGGDDLGPMLTSHPGIDKVSFTGSTATGKKVMESCSKTLKRVTLELGGNDPAIVCGDVNIKEVAPKIATLAFLNSGQICVALKRIYVHSSIYQEFLQEMVNFTKTILVGDGFGQKEGDGFYIGPIQNQMQYERVKGFLTEIEEHGLNVLVGGQAETEKLKEKKGYFISPTIVDNPADSERVVVEEPFGPVLPVLKWDTEEEVIRRSNDTLMGLGASVWSGSVETANRIARKLQAGNVWVNTHLEMNPIAPFGGHKHSGLGSEQGVLGLKAYTNAQSLFLKKR